MLQARQNNDEWFSQDVNITCMKIVSKHLMTWEWNSVQRRLKQAMLSKVVPRIENTFRKQESGCNFMFSIPLSCSKILHLQNFILLRLQKHSRCLSENCNAWKTFFRLYDNQRSALIYSQQCRLRVDVFFFESSCLFIHSNSFRAYLSPKWFLIASAWLYFSGLMELTFRWVSISFSVKEK